MTKLEVKNLTERVDAVGAKLPEQDVELRISRQLGDAEKVALSQAIRKLQLQGRSPLNGTKLNMALPHHETRFGEGLESVMVPSSDLNPSEEAALEHVITLTIAAGGNASDLDWNRLLAQNDLIAFTEALGYKNAVFHKRIYEALQDPSLKRLLLILPPAHGKSTCVSINYVLWKLGNNRNLRFIIASHTRDFVQTFPRAVMQWMKTPAYQAVFGELKPEHPSKWTQSSLVVSRSSLEKDPSVHAVGTEQAIIGGRADEVILDDVLDESISSSQVQREAVKVWYQKELLTRVEPEGRVVCVGTRWHFSDLYSDLLKDPAYTPLVFKAISDQGQALWPDKWPLQVLEARRQEIGSMAFTSQYLCDPTPREGALMKEAWLSYWDEQNEDSANRVYRLPPRQELRILQGWDPAISQTPEADYSVCLTLGLNAGNLYVLEYVRGHWDFPTQIKMVQEQSAKWKPEIIGIESNAYQRALPETLRGGTLPVVEVKQTGNKILRIAALQPYFENGSMRISRTGMDELISEYLEFPKGAHDDILDALHIAFSLIHERPVHQAAGLWDGTVYAGREAPYHG